MARLSYYEKLKLPQWQKKRLEILGRDKWECQNCGDESTTLHVHHTYYEKGLEPWEYPSQSLITLCEPCHKEAQVTLAELHRSIGLLGIGENDRIIGYLRGLYIDHPSIYVLVENYDIARGLADAWGIDTETVINAVCDGKISGQMLSDASRSLQPVGSTGGA